MPPTSRPVPIKGASNPARTQPIEQFVEQPVEQPVERPTEQNVEQQILAHQAKLKQCRQCPDMIPPVITGHPATSPVIQIGQAPGIHEGEVGKPFGWTAGKTLFQWYQQIGVEENHFRQQVYIAAVCRCFPGKAASKSGRTSGRKGGRKTGGGGGDRVPSQQEIKQCQPWLQAEFELLQPELLIPIGKLAISQLIPVGKLAEVIGQQHRATIFGRELDIIPLPHPSGASTWHRTEPGKSLLQDALQLLAAHPVWKAALNTS